MNRFPTSTYYSYAKLNLGLRVINRDMRQYHNIATYFQLIDLYDKFRYEISVNEADLPSETLVTQFSQCLLSRDHNEQVYAQDLLEGLVVNFLDRLRIVGMSDIVPDRCDNLIYKAGVALLSYVISNSLNYDFISHVDLAKLYTGLHTDLIIHATKLLPHQAGIGGGSANAGLMLLALNKFLGLNLTNKELEKISLTVGADCPIFVAQMSQFAWGYGQNFLQRDQIADIVNELASQLLEFMNDFIANACEHITNISSLYSKTAVSRVLHQCYKDAFLNSIAMKFLVVNTYQHLVDSDIVDSLLAAQSHKVFTALGWKESLFGSLLVCRDNYQLSNRQLSSYTRNAKTFKTINSVRDVDKFLTQRLHTCPQFLLIIPKFGISTAEAFKALTKVFIIDDETYQLHEATPAGAEWKAWVDATWVNDFQKVFVKKFPKIAEINAAVDNRMCMSGTGSVFFVHLHHFGELTTFLKQLCPFIEDGIISCKICHAVSKINFR